MAAMGFTAESGVSTLGKGAIVLGMAVVGFMVLYHFIIVARRRTPSCASPRNSIFFSSGGAVRLAGLLVIEFRSETYARDFADLNASRFWQVEGE